MSIYIKNLSNLRNLNQLIKISLLLSLSLVFISCTNENANKKPEYKATLPLPKWSSKIASFSKNKGGILFQNAKNDPIPATKIGYAYSEELKDYDKAIKWYKYSNSMKAMPDNSNYLCFAYQKKKEYQEAISWCKNAISLGSNEALFRLGKVNELNKNYNEAIIYYKKAFEKTKDKMALSNIGSSYFELKNYKEAEIWYKKAIKEGNLGTYQNIATFYHEGLKNDIKASAYAIALINKKYTKKSVLKLLQKTWKIPNKTIKKGYDLQKNSKEFLLKFTGDLGLEN